MQSVSNFVDSELLDVSDILPAYGTKTAARGMTPAGQNADIASTTNSRQSRGHKLKLQLGALK